MKFLFAFIATLFLSFNALKAQDLIITTKEDSIQCRIIRIEDDYILFSRQQQSQVVRVKIPAGNVKMYEKGFYTVKNVSGSAARIKATYDKVTISSYGGLSHLIARTSSQVPSGFRQYIKELRSGYHFGGDVIFFVSRSTGLGLKYTNFKTSNSSSVTAPNQSGKMQTGVMRDDITVHYIAPVLASRRLSVNQKTILNTAFSIGYLGYTNNATLIDPVKVSGNTAGMGLNLGLEQKVSKVLGLELGVGLIAGSLSKLERTTGNMSQTIQLEDEQRENISRVDISLGLKWHF